MRKLLMTVILGVWSTLSMAKELPEPKMMYISSGVLCNTKAELETLLTGISLNNGQWPETIPEGCGRFTPRQPIPMMVTPLEWYETPMADTLTAHFLFAPQMWEQYGWIAWEPNPNYQPASLDIDA